jgi:hypothetical protein
MMPKVNDQKQIKTKDPKSKPENCRQRRIGQKAYSSTMEQLDQHRRSRSLFRQTIRGISKQKSNSNIETPNQMKATSKRQH